MAIVMLLGMLAVIGALDALGVWLTPRDAQGLVVRAVETRPRALCGSGPVTGPADTYSDHGSAGPQAPLVGSRRELEPTSGPGGCHG